MVEIKRVGILSLALMSGLLYTALGLIIGLLFACVSVLGLSALAGLEESLGGSTGFGGGEILFSLLYAICMPILYGVIGFIAGAIIGVLYNIIAGVIGGIKVELVGGDLVKGP